MAPRTPLLVLAVLAGLLLVGGTIWMLLSTGLSPGVPSVGTADDRPAAIAGRKSPKDFGFPVYPSAFEFHSTEIGQEQWSAAFSFREGKAVDVAAFYQQKLEPMGWQYRSKTPTTQKPGDAAHPGPGTATGWKLLWTKPDTGRQLELIALDLPQKGSAGQAVLSWAPAQR